MAHDETLLGVSEKVKNFAVVCELPSPTNASALPVLTRPPLLRHLRHHEGPRLHQGQLWCFCFVEFRKSNRYLCQMYELYDPCTTM